MKADFWLERWQQQQIGFHAETVHSSLPAHWHRLGVSKGRVFVPLCGKSLDMNWLNQQGYEVFGIELSPIAIEAFFADTPPSTLQITEHTSFTQWEAHGITVRCGDFFALEPHDVADCVAIYDRAALIALPPDMQQRYVTHLIYLFGHLPPTLLITLDYDQTITKGPPFSVPITKINHLFSDHAQIKVIDSKDLSQEPSGLQRKGVTSLWEHTLVLY